MPETTSGSKGKTYQGKPCKHGHSGLRYACNHVCVACGVEKVRRWRAENPERVKAQQKARYWKDPARAKREVAEWRKKNPGKVLAWSRRWAGVPEPTYPAPPECECCQAARKLHADHDHSTGKFRGWLCSRCNRAIGGLGDTLAGLLCAIGYLRRKQA